MNPRTSPPRAGGLRAATGRSGREQAVAQLEQRDQRLGVLRLGDDRVDVRRGADLYVDPLVLGGGGPLVDVGDAGRQVQEDLLAGEPGRRVERPELPPVLGALADLLRELALGRLERALAMLVELAGRDLEQVGLAHGLARLADEPQPVAVEHDDAHGAGMVDDRTLDLLPVLVAEGVRAQRDEAALVDGLGPDALEARAHAADSMSASATSSVPSSAATETRSLGSWLRSVPLARFTQCRPAASSAFASDPPPVLMWRGS